jgi:hypothetical protein
MCKKQCADKHFFRAAKDERQLDLSCQKFHHHVTLAKSDSITRQTLRCSNKKMLDHGTPAAQCRRQNRQEKFAHQRA